MNILFTFFLKVNFTNGMFAALFVHGFENSVKLQRQIRFYVSFNYVFVIFSQIH